MFGSNVPARFKTENGSEYVVTTDGVLRRKFYDSEDEKAKAVSQKKNMFFLGYDESEAVLDQEGSDAAWRVEHTGSEFFLAYLPDDAPTEYRRVKLVKAPALGLAALDVFLESDGRFSSESGMHIGHKVSAIL